MCVVSEDTSDAKNSASGVLLNLSKVRMEVSSGSGAFVLHNFGNFSSVISNFNYTWLIGMWSSVSGAF